MFEAAQSSSRSHLPNPSYLAFVLIAGLMAGLVVLSLISAPKTRAASEDRDLRGQLQTELRSLMGAPSLAPAASREIKAGVPLEQSPPHANWKLLALIAGIAVIITIWATINYYVASTTELDDSPPAAVEAQRPPLVSTPEWMKIAVRNSRDGMMTLDSAGRIMTANPAAEKLLGSEPGRLPGQRVFEYLPELGTGPDDLRRFSQVASHTDVAAKRKDGGGQPVRLALYRVSELGDPRYLAAFFAPEPAAALAAPSVSTPATAAATAAPEAAEQSRPLAAASAVNEQALRDLENQVVMLGGYSELVFAALDAAHPARPDAEAVSRSAARANLLCHEVSPLPQVYSRRVDLNEFAIAIAAPLARVLDHGCEVKGFRGQAAAEVWADTDLLERAVCSLAWRTQELAGGLRRVSISVSDRRLDLRMIPSGPPGTTTAAAFDALQAVDWIEEQNGSIEMEERSETGVRFRIWLPEPAQSQPPRRQRAATRLAAGSRTHAAD